MAKYRNREVEVIEELRHPNGDLVRIEHREPGVTGSEIVPVSQVWVSEDEKKNIDKLRDQRRSANDFRIIGKDEYQPEQAPTVEEVKVQKMAEQNLERMEQVAKERDEFQKKYPHAPAGAFEQYQTTRVANPAWSKTEKKAGK